MATVILNANPLNKEVFAPFGDVIEAAGSHHYPINNGTTERYHDLAQVDVLEQGGRTLINIFSSQPTAAPVKLWVMERHPLGSQAFYPMSSRPFLVVVAVPGGAPGADYLHAFITDGKQGVNYHRGVWHHPVLALDDACDFLVVDRGGNGHNCDEVPIDPGMEIIVEY